MSDKPYEFTEMQLQWLDALESGTFKQGRTWLYNEESQGYCCLGVFAFGVLGSTLRSDRATLTTHEKAALKLHCKGCGRLVTMNDSQKMPFDEIAAAVREEPRKFFND